MNTNGAGAGIEPARLAAGDFENSNFCDDKTRWNPLSRARLGFPEGRVSLALRCNWTILGEFRSPLAPIWFLEIVI